MLPKPMKTKTVHEERHEAFEKFIKKNREDTEWYVKYIGGPRYIKAMWEEIKVLQDELIKLRKEHEQLIHFNR